MNTTTQVQEEPSALSALVGLQEGLKNIEADVAVKRMARNDYIQRAAGAGHSMKEIGDAIGLTKAAVHKIVHG